MKSSPSGSGWDASWEKKFEERVAESIRGLNDPAHDLTHYHRVSRTAKVLAKKENANLEVVIPAAWLHDLVPIAKTDPRRTQASRISGEAAVEYLRSINYPTEHLEEIRHAIEAHSHSAKIEARTLEAKVVQDADRLDALGAVGIARCFTIGGVYGRKIYSPEDPLCISRKPNDGEYTIDHFFTKLFRLPETFNTVAAREEGEKRVRLMQGYLDQLHAEIG